MNTKTTQAFGFAAVLLIFFALCGTTEAQVHSGYGNPFADDDEPLVQQPVLNGLGDAAAQLFGPEQSRNIVAVPAAPDGWQNLGATDPNGAYSNAYSDSTTQRIEAVLNAPLIKKKPFSDPLDEIKKDPDLGELFGPQRRE